MTAQAREHRGLPRKLTCSSSKVWGVAWPGPQWTQFAQGGSVGWGHSQGWRRRGKGREGLGKGGKPPRVNPTDPLSPVLHSAGLQLQPRHPTPPLPRTCPAPWVLLRWLPLLEGPVTAPEPWYLPPICGAGCLGGWAEVKQTLLN